MVNNQCMMNKTNNTVVNDNMIDDTKIGDDHD
jgi:hypothetical protein